MYKRRVKTLRHVLCGTGVNNAISVVLSTPPSQLLTLPVQYAEEQGLYNGRCPSVRLSVPSIDSSRSAQNEGHKMTDQQDDEIAGRKNDGPTGREIAGCENVGLVCC